MNAPVLIIIKLVLITIKLRDYSLMATTNRQMMASSNRQMILLDYIGFTLEKNKKASQRNLVVMWDGNHKELNDIVRLQRVSCNRNLVVRTACG